MTFNLILVAVVAPLLALWLRRRRPDLPKVVAQDTTGTALVVRRDARASSPAG